MADARQVIARQMTRSGETLIIALEPVSDDEFFAENPDGLSAARVTGHLACVADLFSSWFDGCRLLSAEFHQVFNDTAVTAAGPGSKAAGVSRELYPKADLLLWFRQAMVKALRALNAFDLSHWDTPGPPGLPVTMRTGGDVWEFLGGHTYWHCGGLASSMSRFRGTYTLNLQPHHLYVPPERPDSDHDVWGADFGQVGGHA
jgi:hypothetical protein